VVVKGEYAEHTGPVNTYVGFVHPIFNMAVTGARANQSEK
jgi:hypothetical protein